MLDFIPHMLQGSHNDKTPLESRVKSESVKFRRWTESGTTVLSSQIPPKVNLTVAAHCDLPMCCGIPAGSAEVWDSTKRVMARANRDGLEGAVEGSRNYIGETLGCTTNLLISVTGYIPSSVRSVKIVQASLSPLLGIGSCTPLEPSVKGENHGM